MICCGCLTLNAQTITTVAGSGFSGPLGGDGGPATLAKIAATNIAIDGAGNLFIPGGFRIRRVDAVSGIITTVAGTGVSGSSIDGIPATNAMINPSTICVDALGNVYFNDMNRIRKVDVVTGIISTFAGNGIAGPSGDGIPATASNHDFNCIAFDVFGNMIVGCAHKIKKISPSGIITTVAGTGAFGSSGDGGPAMAAAMSPRLFNITTDVAGNIYFIDTCYTVRKIDVSTGIITRVAGTGSCVFFPYGGDGHPATASQINIQSIGVDWVGNLYMAGGPSVYKVNGAGIISTIGGTGVAGFGGDGGPATSARLSNYNQGMVLDRCSNVYIADFSNARVRKITVVPTCNCMPAVGVSAIPGDTVCAGTSATFTATVTGGGSTTTYQWYVNGAVVSTSGSTYSYTPASGDSIRCIISTTGGICTGTVTASSNTRHMVVNPLPFAGTITGASAICIGQSSTCAAVPGGIWGSSNTAVATIGSSSGIVSGLTAGTTVISYSVTNSCGTAVAMLTTTVGALPAITGDLAVHCIGGTTTLSHISTGGTWSSGNAAIASVGSSSGIVTGMVAGTADLTYTVAAGCYTTSIVTVDAALPPISGPTHVCTGSSVTLANTVTGGLWSSGSSLLSIGSSSGIVTGNTAGTADITYTVGSCPATATVTVDPLPNAGTITGPATLCTGLSSTLGNAVAGGSWLSSNPATATVSSSGVLSGISVGSAIISYTVGPNAFGCSATATFAIAIVAPSFVVSPAITNVRCHGGSDGSIALTLTGGYPPFSFLWSGAQTSSSISGLSIGSYSVSVTETSSQCRKTASYTISQPDSLHGTMQVSDDSCKLGIGKAKLTLTGGTSPYNYQSRTGLARRSRAHSRRSGHRRQPGSGHPTRRVLRLRAAGAGADPGSRGLVRPGPRPPPGRPAGPAGHHRRLGRRPGRAPTRLGDPYGDVHDGAPAGARRPSGPGPAQGGPDRPHVRDQRELHRVHGAGQPGSRHPQEHERRGQVAGGQRRPDPGRPEGGLREPPRSRAAAQTGPEEEDVDPEPVGGQRRCAGAAMKRVDVVALVTGLLFTAVAAASLWLAFTGSIRWELLKVAAPLTLVVVGVIGLALSRNRT